MIFQGTDPLEVVEGTASSSAAEPEGGSESEGSEAEGSESQGSESEGSEPQGSEPEGGSEPEEPSDLHRPIERPGFTALSTSQVRVERRRTFRQQKV